MVGPAGAGRRGRGRAAAANREHAAPSQTMMSAALRRLLSRDMCVVASSPHVRLALVQCTHAAAACAQSWGIDRDARASNLLSRSLAASALLASSLEGEERVSIQFTAPTRDAHAAITTLRAEATAHGELRAALSGAAAPPAEALFNAQRPTIQAGCITSHQAPAIARLSTPLAADTAWDGRLLPDTVLTVSRILYNRREPAISSVLIGGGDDGSARGGDIQADLEHLFAASDQIESAVHLDALVDGERLAYCGGVVAQRIAAQGGKPIASDAVTTWAPFEQVKQRVAALSMSRERAHGLTLHAVAHRLLRAHPPSTVDEANALPAFPTATPLDLFCRCTKPAFLRNLLHGGGRALVTDLLREHVESAHRDVGSVTSTGADGGTVVHAIADVATTLSCGQCNRRHYITEAELRVGLAEL